MEKKTLLQDELEQDIRLRTMELLNANEQLKREIEERKQVEAALRLSEEKYSSVVKNSLIGIHINQDGRIVFVNERFARIYGYFREELLGLRIQELIHPDDRDMITDFMLRRFQGRRAPEEYEARGITKDGRVIWLARNSTLINYQGRPAILGNTMDITQRKLAEKALKESERQLHILSKQLLNAQENERVRIAHELHDGVGQYLTAIKFRLENACVQISQKFPQADLTLFEEIVPVIQEALEEVRRISMDLRPSILDDLGLLATLRWFCREFQKANPHIRVVKECNIEENDVPDSLKTVIYRIIQEGFHNVSKHSDATQVDLILTKNLSTLDLCIKDNGRGFVWERDLASPHGEGGLGIASMKKRVELSGGRIKIDSFPLHGTMILCQWAIESNGDQLT